MGVDFSESYLGKLRKTVGSAMLQVPAARVVLINAADEILLQHRRDFGVWGLPGGHPEERESITDCARREVFEETGLTAGELIPYGYSSNSQIEWTVYPNGHVVHSFALLFLARSWSGKPIDSNEETLAVKFFPGDRLPEMLPNERHSVEKYLRYKASGLFQSD